MPEPQAARPPRVTLEPQPVGAARPVGEVLDRISAKMLLSLQDGKKKDCCGQPLEHQVQMFKTASQPDDLGPDMMVFTCACGCRHIRMAGGGQGQSGEL